MKIRNRIIFLNVASALSLCVSVIIIIYLQLDKSYKDLRDFMASNIIDIEKDYLRDVTAPLYSIIKSNYEDYVNKMDYIPKTARNLYISNYY